VKMRIKATRALALIAVTTTSTIFEKSVSALTTVTLQASQNSSQNWSTSGAWSDGSNPATNSATVNGNAYNVSAQVLYAPSLANTATDTFYGGALNLTAGSTLNMSGTSASTYSQTYNFPNLSSGVLVSDSSLVFTSTNATYQNFNGGLNFADTGSGVNTILLITGGYTHILNLTGAITGSGTVNFNASGSPSARTFNVSNANNTYAGAVTLIGLSGTAGSFNLLKTLGSVTTYTIGTDWTLNDGAGSTIANNLINGSNVAVTGTLKIAGTAETLGNVTGAGTISATSSSPTTLTLQGAGTFSGTLSGTAGTLSIVKNGSGNQILSGADTYSGTTAINAGTLTLGNFTGSGEIDLNAGTLASGTNTTLAGNIVAGSTANVIAPGGIGSIGTLTLGTLTTNSATTFNFDLGTGTGIVTNGDTINFTNSPSIAGTSLVFNNSSATVIGNDYRLFNGSISSIDPTSIALPAAPAGRTFALSNTVDPGYIDLVVGSSAFSLFWDNAGGTGDGLTWDNAMQNWNNGTGVTNFSSSNGDKVTFNDTNNGNYNVSIATVVTPGSTTVNASGNYNFSGAGGIGGSGGLIKTGSGILSLATSNTFTGQTNLSAGTINLQNTLALVNTTVNISGGSLTFDAVVASNAFTLGGLTGTSNIALVNTAANPITLSVGNNSAGTTYGGVFSGSGILNKIGSGTLTLTGSNTYTGGTVLTAGVVNLGVGENAGVTGPLGASGIITFAGGTLQYSSANQYDYSSRFSNAANQLFNIDTNGQNVTFATGLSSAGGSLTKLGTGTLQLDASNTYSGATKIKAGTLQLGVANALPATAVVNFTGTSTFDLNGFTPTVASISAVAGATGNINGTLTTNTVLFPSSAAGTANISGGTLVMTNGVIDASAAGGTSVVSGLTEVVSSQITGSGGLTIKAFGNVSDTGGGNNSLFDLTNTANSFTGGVTIAEGLVNVVYGDGIFNNAGAASTNAVSISTGAGLISSGTVTLSTASIILSGSGNHYIRVYGSQTLTLNGNISGAGGLYHSDAGTLVLNGTNSYTGVTTINDGALTVNGDNSAATGGWAIGTASANTTTVNFTSGSLIDAVGGSSITVGATGAYTSQATQTLNVATTVNNAGSLAIGRSGMLNINSGATWNQSGAVMIAPPLGSGYSAYLNVNSGGTFNYSGSSTIGIGATGNSTNGDGLVTITGGTFITNQGFTDGASNTGGGSSITITGGGVLQLSGNIPALTTTAGQPFNILLGSSGGTLNTNGFNTSISSPIGNVTSNTGVLTLNGGGTVTLSGTNTYTGGTNVNAGALDLVSAASFPATTNLTIASNASTVLLNHSTGTTVAMHVNTLSDSGTLNITNNALVIHNPGSLQSIVSLVQSGFNGGAWNGSGITSSAAMSDSTHLTALGVITNDNGSGTALYTTFDKVTSSDGDVLVKYTYYGDANLDGKVDGSDYSLIDNAYEMEGWVNGVETNAQITGWYNGDFNYDGNVNGSDYTLIDNAFNSQGAQLSAEIASPTAEIAPSGGVSAVPEPTTLGLLGIGAIGLLGRRRRRI
jgi:fibronectin-binding autotransporter adhesin